MNQVQYPYLPVDKIIKYVPKDNTFILQAKAYAKKYSTNKSMPVAAVIVKDGVVIGHGTNRSLQHRLFGCERIKQGCGSGKNYELCKGCHPKKHAEPLAIASAQSNEFFTEGTDLYIWGQWWCCESCWNKIIKAGIKDVYLMEGSDSLFCKEHPDNIIGKQFKVN